MRALLFILLVTFLFSFLSCTDEGKGMTLAVPVFQPQKKEIPKPAFSAELLEKQHLLDSLFSAQNHLGYFNGCVAVLYHDTVVYQKAFGIENLQTKKELRNASLFQLASVSKMFTALAVLKLAEQQKLSVKDPLDKYFPDFPYKGTTIEHLLMHKSGLPNYLYFYYQYAKNDSVPFTNARVLELMAGHKPLPYFKPGRRFMYSNTNYVLLALLVEQLSGKPFTEYVRQEIFEPCGMKQTKFLHPPDTLANQAFAFDYRKRQVGFDLFDGVYGDKGIYSTAGDMLLFAKALYSDKMFSLTQCATKPRVYTKYGQFYGYGFRINPNMGDTVVFHNGWWHGFRTAFHYRKSDKTAIVVLSNRMDKAAYQAWKLFDVLDKKVSAAESIAAGTYSE